MSTPQDVVVAAIAAIQAALPELREVEAHPGRFNLDEAKRIFAHAPAVRVAFLGVARFERDGSGYLDAVCSFGAMIATNASGQQALPAAEAAAAIACAIAVLVDRNDWSLADVGDAQVTRIENLYGADVDRAALALWGVAWTQVVRLGADAFFSEGVVPSRIYVGVAPAVGAAHQGTYEDVQSGEAPDA